MQKLHWNVLDWAKQLIPFKMNTMELDTKQNVNVHSFQSHWVLISEAGVWASRWHQMTSRPAATLPCQNISWLAFPAFLALVSKTLRSTQHLTLEPLSLSFLFKSVTRKWPPFHHLRPWRTSETLTDPFKMSLPHTFFMPTSCCLHAAVLYWNFFQICLN